MRESEARKKLCWQGGESPGNQGHRYCLGTDCMAWRTTQPTDPNVYSYDATGKAVYSKDVGGVCGMVLMSETKIEP